MSPERRRILFDIRVLLLWLGLGATAVTAVAVWPDAAMAMGGPAVLGLGLAGAVLLHVAIDRWRHARAEAGLPVAWTGPGPPPEKEGFGRFVLWFGLCFLWMIPASFFDHYAIGQDGAARGGWALISLACWAEAVRWMCAPERPDAHEDELYGFALGLLAPLAFPLTGWVAMSATPAWWASVALGLVGAPLAMGWQLRRARRLMAGEQQARGADGAGGLA